MKQFLFAVATPILFLALGCGYHVTGQGDLVPKTVKTIAIPGFQNITTRYDLSKLLPEDISSEFLTRTRYKVISDASRADAVLNGAIVNFVFFPTTFDTATGRSTGVEVVVTMRLTLTNRATKEVIWSRPSIEFRERYEIAENPQQYFDESGTAMIKLSQDVARSIVSALQQAF
jgi:hypothetical protein